MNLLVHTMNKVTELVQKIKYCKDATKLKAAAITLHLICLRDETALHALACFSFA